MESRSYLGTEDHRGASLFASQTGHDRGFAESDPPSHVTRHAQVPMMTSFIMTIQDPEGTRATGMSIQDE